MKKVNSTKFVTELLKELLKTRNLLELHYKQGQFFISENKTLEEENNYLRNQVNILTEKLPSKNLTEEILLEGNN